MTDKREIGGNSSEQCVLAKRIELKIFQNRAQNIQKIFLQDENCNPARALQIWISFRLWMWKWENRVL